MAENHRRSEALRTRVHLQSRGLVDDGFGNMLPGGEFSTVYTVWANLHALKGSETVIAARLAGRQPYLMTVRQSSDTRLVNESWRVVEKEQPDRIYAITAPATDPDGKRAWHEFLLVLGEPS
jgi:head-tail adaptor